MLYGLEHKNLAREPLTWLSSLSCQAWQPKLDPWDPHGGRKPTPDRCPLTSAYVLFTLIHVIKVWVFFFLGWFALYPVSLLVSTSSSVFFSSFINGGSLISLYLFTIWFLNQKPLVQVRSSSLSFVSSPQDAKPSSAPLGRNAFLPFPILSFLQGPL